MVSSCHFASDFNPRPRTLSWSRCQIPYPHWPLRASLSLQGKDLALLSRHSIVSPESWSLTTQPQRLSPPPACSEEVRQLHSSYLDGVSLTVCGSPKNSTLLRVCGPRLSQASSSMGTAHISWSQLGQKLHLFVGTTAYIPCGKHPP